MSDATLQLGTRGGALALAQAGPIAQKLGAGLVVVDGQGDAATLALRTALLAGEVDLVVHAFKELPIAEAEGVVIAAVPKRGDARDALCARDGLTLDDLPPGARVGTGSARRRAQLLARRPDLEVVEIGDDIETRLARIGTDLDAVVLAAAGVDRFDRLDLVTEFIGIDGWPTTPGQGALAIEVRRGDERSVSKLDHSPSRLAAEAERGILTRLGANSSAPVGAHALLDDGLLFLTARVYSLDGSAHLTSSHALYPEDALHPAADLADRVSAELLSAGATELAPLAGDPSRGADAE
ncbi:MAG: hydroxymethylbilane synthase [Pseudolysinimonas sp.]